MATPCAEAMAHTVIAATFRVVASLCLDEDDPSALPAGTRVRYFYDGWQVVEERIIQPGASGSSATVWATYVYGNYIDEVVQMQRDLNGDGVIDEHGTETFYYHTDDMYNVVAITNGQGEVVERYEYTDYGQPIVLTPEGSPRTTTTSGTSITSVDGAPISVIGNPYMFTGRRYDWATGLYHYRHRYYDPVIGRFTTVDPLGLWGDPGNTGNGYTYVANNPWSMLDPFGLCPPSANKPHKRGFAKEVAHELYWDLRTMWELLRGGYSSNPSDSEMLIYEEFSRQVHDRTAGTMDLFGVDVSGGVTFDPEARAEAKQMARAIVIDTAINVVAAVATGGTSVVARLVVAGVRLYDVYNTGRAAISAYQNIRDGNYVAAFVDAVSVAVDVAGGRGSRSGKAGNCKQRGGCFLAGTLVAVQGGYIQIEDLRVGDRVLTTDEQVVADIEPKLATWRRVSLTMPNPEAPGTSYDIEVLRPLDWLAMTGAEEGGTITFSLPELNLFGEADVVAIEPCPEIEPGLGRVVLATVTHRNETVHEIRFDDGVGALYPTARHRLYSLDRDDWVRTDQLVEGETLRTAHGSAAIASIRRYPGSHRVYNLEVQTEHCFFVSAERVLCHNADGYTGGKASTLGPGPHAKESIPGHNGGPTAAEQRRVNELMEKHGCHTCGTRDPGTRSGNAVVDHQPPKALGETTEFYPHCLDCARRQGGEVLKEKLRSAGE